MNVHAFLGGLGSAFGYVLSAIKWENTIFKFIGDDLQILFVFVTVFFVLTLIITLTAVSETPIVLKKIDRVPLLGN